MHVIQRLYERATSAVFINGNIGDWYHTTVGVRQGYILSPTLFNIFLERIMSDVLEEHKGTISIAGRTITNLRFADDIDGLAGSEQELAQLVESLEQTSRAYGMEVNAELDFSLRLALSIRTLCRSRENTETHRPTDTQSQ